MGDLRGLMETMKDLNLEKDTEGMMKRIAQGQFTIRDFYEQFQKIMQLGPLSQIIGMFPGMSADFLPKEAEENSSVWFRKMLCMMDSMTKKGTVTHHTVHIRP